MSPQATILSRIKKLLNLTEARGATPDEAANAAAKVQAILFEHNLSMSQVDGHTLDSPGEKVGEAFTAVKGAKNSMRWRQSLYARIAQYHFCDVLFLGRTHVTVIGKASNVEVVQYMGEYIGDLIHKMARKAMLDDLKRTGVKQNWPYYTAYAQGAVATIGERLYAQQKKQENVSGCTALVVQTGKELTTYIETKYPKLGKARPQKSSRTDAWLHGRKDGHNIPLSKGLTHSTPKARLS